MAIPKIIHYCWLSNDPVPNELRQYMATWEKYMPDYEYVKWDFSRFDINSSIWVKEAFEAKKYAFAADYIRLYALYTMGGIYLDMDVEIVRPFDDLLEYPYFICWENHFEVQIPEMAIMGVEKGCWWIKLILDHYRCRHFVKENGIFDTMTLPRVTEKELAVHRITLSSFDSAKKQLYQMDRESVIRVLPCDFFSPKSYETGEINLTDNTYSIHQFSGSWIPWEQRIEGKIWRALGVHPHRYMWHVDRWLYRLFHIKR